MKKNYIVTEKTENYGWCLFKALFVRNYDEAFDRWVVLVKENPNKELRIEEIEEKDVWWNY